MINLYDLLKAANGQLFGEPVANLFTDFSLDPQQQGENLLFVALRTDRGDTHQYIEEAIDNGVSGVLCVEPPDCDTSGVSVLMVRDTIDALLAWAQHTLSKLNVRTIAVGGSSAKGVTVDAIARLLAGKYQVHRGNVDLSGRLAIPLSLAKLTPNIDYAVLRLSTTRPGEMAQMVTAIKPSIAIVNHIDCLHSGGFDNCQQYIEEEATLIDYLSPGALAVLNYDDDNARELAHHARDGVIIRTIGIDRFGADALAFNVKASTQRIGFDLRFGDERYLARWSPILGKHHLYGLLSALMVAAECDVDIDQASRMLSDLETLPGRMHPHHGKNRSLLIDDTYNASYLSTMADLDWLQNVRDEHHRTIFVLGDMNDMGSNNRYAHRAVGQRAAEAADLIVTQGVEAALAGRSAIDSGKNPNAVRVAYSAQDVVSIIDSFDLTEQDIILVKGSESARMEQVVRELIEDGADETNLVRQGETRQHTSQAPVLRPSWLEFDADTLANNVRIVREQVGPDVALMAVVKADGYGHGSVLAARTALVNGAQYLAVASMAEAMELRDAGIKDPILVLSYAPAESVRQAVHEHITLAVYDMEQARLFDRAARSVLGNLKVHVKIDTGMGRLGVFAEDAIQLFRHLNTFPNLEVEGVFTHFSTADSDIDYTDYQLDMFQNVVRPLRAAGFSFKYIHAANSPALLLGKESHFNMVRVGLLLYGMNPGETAPIPEGIRPCMTWKTTVLQVKTFPPGHPIGYGNTYMTQREERIAILPVGYADGLRRSPQTWQYVLVHGKRAPIVGRVSMEKVAVNVDDMPGVATGDEVVLLGKQGDEEITPDMVAEWLGTINYEVVTTILPRIPRM